jgi:hypothetical protein
MLTPCRHACFLFSSYQILRYLRVDAKTGRHDVIMSFCTISTEPAFYPIALTQIYWFSGIFKRSIHLHGKRDIEVRSRIPKHPAMCCGADRAKIRIVNRTTLKVDGHVLPVPYFACNEEPFFSGCQGFSSSNLSHECCPSHFLRTCYSYKAREKGLLTVILFIQHGQEALDVEY